VGTVSAESDESLWAAARRGDGEAFGVVFDRHRARVLRHALRLVDRPEDAEDVVAVAFLESWRNRGRVRFVDASIAPWLLATATNAARNLRRSSRRHRALLDRLPPPAPARDHAEDLVDREATAALRALSLDDQRVIVLCVVEGLGVAEAAAVLGIAPGTVKSRLSRAKARLRGGVARSIGWNPVEGSE